MPCTGKVGVSRRWVWRECEFDVSPTILRNTIFGWLKVFKNSRVCSKHWPLINIVETNLNTIGFLSKIFLIQKKYVSFLKKKNP